jgi:hypothetical protein
MLSPQRMLSYEAACCLGEINTSIFCSVSFHTRAVILSLFVGTTTPAWFYLFSASVGIVSTSAVVWHAWKWPDLEVG